MTSSEPVRRARSTMLGVLAVVGAALVGVLVHQSLVSSSSDASPIDVRRDDHHLLPGDRQAPDDEVHDTLPRDNHRGALGQQDGAVPDGVTVFDDEIPAVAELDPALRDALRRAAIAAAGQGVRLFVDSGWRSPEYQQQLLREAVSKYGSEKEAARWVATPDTSAHVSGDAVDIGPSSATTWLNKHGAEYGLCQIYRNEPWHYELRPDAIDHGCPLMYADPSQDPRMQP